MPPACRRRPRQAPASTSLARRPTRTGRAGSTARPGQRSPPLRRRSSPPAQPAPDPASAPNDGLAGSWQPPRTQPPDRSPERPRPIAEHRHARRRPARPPTPRPSGNPRYPAPQKCLPNRPSLDPQQAQNRLTARHFTTSKARVAPQDQLLTEGSGLVKTASVSQRGYHHTPRAFSSVRIWGIRVFRSFGPLRLRLTEECGKIRKEAQERLPELVEPNPSFISDDHGFVEMFHGDEWVLPRANVNEPCRTHGEFCFPQCRDPARPQVVEGCDGKSLSLRAGLLRTEDLLDVHRATGPEDAGRLPEKGCQVGGVTGHLKIESDIERSVGKR